MENLHDRAAKALGWTGPEARRFSLASLRELVRAVAPTLAAEMTDEIRSGRVLSMLRRA